MSQPRKINRREFLSISLLSTGAAVLAACSAPTPQPTTAPAAPTTAPTAVPPTATTAPKPTTAPTAVPPTVAPTVAPTSAPSKVALGKLEGPELVLDAAKYPKTFSEAPMLADLVKAGKLPKLEERLPKDVMVIKPLNEVGKYGGTWKSGFTGAGDSYNGIRLAGDDHILFFDYTVSKITPNLAASWKVSDDGKSTTLTLRNGLKWSDGSPFTADYFLFWFEDIYSNKDLWPTPSSYMAINGKQGKMEKVDAQTVKYTFESAYFLFPDVLAGWNPLTSHSAWGFNGNGGGFAPKNYLKQFHVKYADKADLDKKMADGKFDTWMKLFSNKNSWALNPDLPTVTPWKTVTPVNTPNWTLERNPYYYGVDTTGNQLPYMDKISLSLAENVEVVNLRAIAGEFDYQARHVDIQKLPVFAENQQKGNYKIYIDPENNGGSALVQFIQSYNEDPEITKWITNADFRRAFSQGIDRGQINEAFFLGLGTPGSVIPIETNLYFPGQEYRTKYHTLDVKSANDLLDKIGLSKKDDQGYRLRTDGKGRLKLEVVTVSGQFVNFTKVAEMMRTQLGKIGLEFVPKEVDRTLSSTMMTANQIALYMWNNGGTDMLFDSIDNLIMWFGSPYRTWLSNSGKAPTTAANATPVPFLEPPALIKEVWTNWLKAFSLPEKERVVIGQNIWKTIVDNCYTVGLVGLSPASMGVRIVKNTMGNIPARQVVNTAAQTPCQSRPSTFYFKA